jgi:hypothetical protein
MESAPVLLLAYNRPEKLSQLIQRIRVLRPSVLLVSVDGPKISKPGDKDLVLATQKIIQSIDWDVKIETRFREENIGLRLAVQDSVNWAISQYGKVIVIEDDAVPGPQLLDFFNFNLQKFADDQKVMHVSGYNVVPPQNLLSETGSRFSRYPESFAWATWERAWKHYDENLTWGLESSVRDIAKITGSTTSALRWKLNFHDAAAGRIGSWAYRWISSMWSQNGTTVAPNRNLLSYSGFDEGTHTLRKPRWKDLPIEHLDYFDSSIFNDETAEQWTGTRIFRESMIGLADGLASSAAMSIRAKWRKRGTSTIWGRDRSSHVTR